MPTGYTAKLHDGDQSFEEFIWSCARAFGALIHMRDDPTDAPIRLSDDAFDCNYGEATLKSESAELERLRHLSRADCDREAAAEYAKEMDGHLKYEATKAEIRKRYERMIQRVTAWTPPTAEHQGLKDFMLHQLQEALAFDCSPSSPPQKLDGYTWVQHRLGYLARVIGNAAESAAQQESSRRSRQEWLQALAKAVPLPKAAKGSSNG